MQRRFSRLFAALVLLSSSIASADTCERILTIKSTAWLRPISALKKTNRQIEKGTLTRIDRERIDQIYKDPKLSTNEKAGVAFVIGIEARLRTLPEHLREELVEILENRSATYGIETHATGTYYSGQRRIDITVPEAFRGTAAEYAILTHEFEHAVQHLVAYRAPLASAQIFNRMYKSRYLMEEGAMGAEWQYLSTIPFKERMALLKKIQDKSDELPAGSTQLFVDMLSFSQESRATYLNFFRTNGRYNRRHVLREIAKPQAAVYLVEGGAAMFVMPMAWLGICNSLVDRTKRAEHHGPFIQRFCRSILPRDDQAQDPLPSLITPR